MNDMITANGYALAQAHMQELFAEAENARLVRAATRNAAGKQAQAFRPATAIETVLWAVGRWGRNATPDLR